jgi:hypothetical protein
MFRVQIRLLDVMAIVGFAAIIFGLYAYIDRTPVPANHVHESAIAIYIAVLCSSALAARAGRLRWRPFWSGLALFGGVYLAIGLKMGWGVSNHIDSASVVFRCQIALPLGLLCGMAAQWLMMPPSSAAEDEG